MSSTPVTEQQSKEIFATQTRIKTLMGWADAKAWMWMGSNNPMFGGVSPAELIILGKGEKLNNFIQGAEDEMAFLRKLEQEADQD